MDHTEQTDEQPVPAEHQGEHQDEQSEGTKAQPNRREFLRTVAAVGAGLAISPRLLEAAPAKGAAKPHAPVVQGTGARQPHPVKMPAAVKAPPKPDDIHVAMIGPGNEGRNLMVNCLRIPGVRFVAVCDIWPFAQTY